MPVTPETPLSGFDFSDAPGGDQTLDDIFNIGDTTVGEDSTTTQTQQTQSEPESFLKTSTGTIYKTADDAVAGIEHKDALIAQLRQQLTASTGQDPIKPKPQEPEYESYSSNPKKYFEDIKKATTEQEVLAVQGRYIQEQLAPYAPLIASVAKNRAVEEAATEIPEFTKFLGSDDYKQTLDSYPLLKRSIEIAESNPQAAQDLGQLYRMAFNTAAGKNLSKIVQQNGHQTVIETRPTVSSTTPAPPGTQRVAPPTFATTEGRQSIIDTQKARGVEDIRF